MKRIFIILICVLLLISTYGCGNGQNTSADTTNNDTSQSTEPPTSSNEPSVSDTNEDTVAPENDRDETIDIAGIGYTVNELVDMLTTNFNNMLFFQGEYVGKHIHTNSNLILGKEIEYLFYLTEEYQIYSGTKYYLSMVITNVSGLPDILDDQFYLYEFEVNERGIASKQHSSYSVAKDDKLAKKASFMIYGFNYTYLGEYTLCLEEIEVPSYGEKSDEWKSYAVPALKSSLAEPNGMAKSLPPGTYDVYVRNFNPADDSTYILIIREDGLVYEGYYYYPNAINANGKASLNKICPAYTDENGEYSEGTLICFEKIKETAALHFVFEKTTDVTVDEIVEESDYHQIIRSDLVYYCYFYNNDHEVIKEEGPLGKLPTVTIVGENLLRFTLQAGTGISTRRGYYYDTANMVFSEVFTGIFDECNGKVACVGMNKVVVSDIFDRSKYLKEFSNFTFPFSPSATPITNIEFSEDCSSIKITYLTGEDYQEVTETFSL